MRNNKGQFVKGQRSSPSTEFKPGEHWRKPQAFREKDYLLEEYTKKGRSTGEIAAEFGVTNAAILFWLRKHGIPRRTVSEARELKHWGLKGEQNGMYGRTGEDNPRWRGGCTPERQAFYASREWAAACSAVWARDNATCQRCGIHHSKAVQFHIHHIVSFSVVELRAEVSNLILLCETCHDWVHSKKNTQQDFIKEVQ